jgi:hypothetical protein
MDLMPSFKLTQQQNKAMQALVSDAQHIAVGGGSRCVSGETVLDGHYRTIQELSEIGEPIPVMTSHGIRVVDAPFKKGEDRLLKITTESGRSIEVTTDHRFWDGSQWIHAEDVKVNSLLACQLSEQNLPRSSSVSYLSKLRASVQSLKRKLVGCLDDCFGGPHQCGQQLHLFEDYDPICHASQSGEPERNLQGLYLSDRVLRLLELNNRMDRPCGHASECNQNGLESFRHANTDDSPLSARIYESLDFDDVRICEWFQGLRSTSLTSRWLSNLSLSIRLLFRNIRRESFRFSCYDSFDTPDVNGYELEKVSTITRTSKKPYYTIHVPIVEEYFANGLLHHNSGKTFLLVRAAVIRALKAPNSRHVIFRFTFKSVKSAVGLDTLPKMMRLCFPQLPSVDKMMDKTDWYIKLPNGSEVWLAGLDDSDRVEKILGMEFATIYFNECSQIPYHSIEMALTRLAQNTNGVLALKAYYDFNPPSKQHWTYLQFVEKKNPITKKPLLNPENYAFFLINPIHNKENLPPEYLEFLETLSPKKRDRFLLGKFAEDSDGALWTPELLHQNRILDGVMPDFLRIIVAVDPSGCSGPEDQRSDEVGIVVAALGTDGHCYILEDLSGSYSPEQWSSIVNDAFDRHEADRVVAEKNFGGDMVRAVLQAQNSELPYTEVTASRGKVIRAEPIAALYEQGKVHHVGRFMELEDQLCSFTLAGFQGLKSPDRGDALVWAVTELFPKMTRKAEQNWQRPQVNTTDRSASRFSGRRY